MFLFLILGIIGIVVMAPKLPTTQPSPATQPAERIKVFEDMPPIVDRFTTKRQYKVLTDIMVDSKTTTLLDWTCDGSTTKFYGISGVMRVPGWGDVAIDLAGLNAAGQVPLLADHDARVGGVVGHGEARVVDGRLIVAAFCTAMMGSL
jgi:hypothetical protein